MSNNNYWDEDEDDLDMDSTAEGGDLVKKLRKAKRADEKRIKELTEQLETFTKSQRESTVKQILEKKGVNQKAARLILKDLEGDFSEDSVSNWLDDNADLFGLQVQDTQKEQNLSTLRQQDTIAQSAITPDRAEDFELRLNNAGSTEDIIDLLRSQQ
jgi:hypothetical protein